MNTKNFALLALLGLMVVCQRLKRKSSTSRCASKA